MSHVLVFDLETVPDVQGLKRLHADLAHLTDDVEVIKKATERLQEEKGTDFFPLHLQKIVTISCVFRGGKEPLSVRSLGSENSSEEELIQQFFKIIDFYSPRLVSWNGNGFDLPVLHYRSLIHKIASQTYWDTGDHERDKKYNNYLSRYHTKHIDLMDSLAKLSGRNAPLDQMAKLCGYPGKLDMDGSQVWQQWYSGQSKAVRDYCETDVMNTWLLYCRFLYIKGDIFDRAYEEEMNLARSLVQELAKTHAHWQDFLDAWVD
ncbi:3'-5' exonuclease [Basilea psittacipulmonis]|uniref:3'-5' exonuclease n=1 Tax=Basilea psittacipulmonis DSM 24701 TaxID=1072685 RepID=A0A077DDX9_9BURK|nr:3'-5' exonuclease [Basilea psittacipulmonis]AIL32834.1 3'-5' exonuclease [Basilea psittacipulmonis DSM 24701]